MCFRKDWFTSVIRPRRVPVLEAATPAAHQPSPSCSWYFHCQPVYLIVWLSFSRHWIVEFTCQPQLAGENFVCVPVWLMCFFPLGVGKRVCHGSKATVQIWNCSCHDSCNPSLLTPVSKRWEEFRTWNWHLTTENILWILYFSQVSGLGWEKREKRKSRWRYCMFWGWGFPNEKVYMNNDLFQEVFQPLVDFNWKIIK